MIAGDIYDKSSPSAEAFVLFNKFLEALYRRRVPVMIISGNHDSSERLSFASRMLAGAGIFVSPVYDGTVQPVILRDSYGEVAFWLLPFLRPADVRRFYPEETIESYTDACRVAIDHMDLSCCRNVLVTHQFVTGAATCESEELQVGGTDNVDASIFAPFCYTALGHIHGPQNIGSPRVRYCGTPLKYSFSEADHYKSVTVVELDGDGQVQLRAVALTPLHDLRQVRGSFERITDPANWENTATDDYMHIILTDEEDIPEAAGRLRAIYPNTMKISYDNTRTRCDQIIESAADGDTRSPLELFEELYEQQNNQPMSEAQRRFAQQLIQDIQEGSL